MPPKKNEAAKKLTETELNRFNIALKLNKLKKTQFCYRQGFKYNCFRVYITRNSNRRFPPYMYKAIIEYTNKVYQMAIEGIDPAKYEIIPQADMAENHGVKHISQDELDQIIAENIPELFEYIKNNDVVYMAVSCNKKSKAKYIFKHFRNKKTSIVKKVAYFEKPKKNIIILVTESYNVDELEREYNDGIELIFGDRRNYDGTY